jgi:prepilin-type N-terminal cleavage/methylation domain-containing protein
MMKSTPDSPRAGGRNGFSLPEVVLALGVFAFAAVASLGMLGSSLKGMQAANERDTAIRLTGALEDQLRSVSLDVVYDWVTNGTAVFVYQYRAVGGNGVNAEDPLTSRDPSEADSQLIPRLRDVNDTDLTSELASQEGPLYRVNFEVSQANPVDAANLPADMADYDEAVFAVKVNFYPVPNVTVVPAATVPPSHTGTFTYLR